MKQRRFLFFLVNCTKKDLLRYLSIFDLGFQLAAAKKVVMWKKEENENTEKYNKHR